jgi:hypothetical protein
MAPRPQPPDPAELRRRLCGELARLAETPAGLDRLRRLQASARAAPSAAAEPPAGAAAAGPAAERHPPPPPPAPAPTAIEPQAVAASPARRARPAVAAPARLPGSAAAPRRVVLLGESAAAGMFYRPHVTPAAILARHLSEAAGPARFEVVDLARPAQTDRELVQAAAAALASAPTLLVAFAGNNWIWSGWGPDLGAQAAGGVDDCDRAAEALERQGVPCLRTLVEERQAEVAGRAIDAVAGLAREARVPLLWVLPEVDLPDVVVPHPVYWLPGDGVRRWYHGLRQATIRLERGDDAGARRAAERLLALDGGACAASRGLLAAACRGRGSREAARDACRDAADAASWDRRFRRSSGVNSTVLAALRAGCRRHGLPSVDLPQIFDRVSGPALPGRRLFLDHCHLTLEGMSVAMAAAAAAVPRALAGAEALPLPDGQERALAPPPEATPAVLGLALLQAGLYNANLGYRHWEWIDELLAAALATCPDLDAAIRDYLLARGAPCSPSLTAARRANLASAAALDPRVWERTDLGSGVMERLCDVLVRHGRDPEREIVQTWIAQNPIPAAGLELAAPRHAETYGTGWEDESRRRPPLFRALAPTSTFRFIADGRQDLELDLTARLPSPPGAARAGRVTLSVNGHRVAGFRLAGAWGRRTHLLGRDLLRPGINRVDLEWPLPIAAGDAALAEAVRRLRLGIPADLYPVFGEVFSLRATPRGLQRRVGVTSARRQFGKPLARVPLERGETGAAGAGAGFRG